MDEPAIAQIDAHVGDAAAIDTKEDQIPWLELAAGDRSGSLVLVPGGARHVDTGLTMGVLHQATAVEALPRRAAAVAVGRAQLVHGDGEKAFPHGLAIPLLAHGGTAAAAQQDDGEQETGKRRRETRHVLYLA